jgi:glutaminyl-tRNA synthetase
MSEPSRPANFLAQIVEADLAAGKNGGRVVTRFPPEPNGFLHIGHAKSIALNFGLARQFGGQTHLRFDDTNPTTEEASYVESIEADVRWLGCDWGAHLYYASDLFEQMYGCAERLVREGKAYVDSQPQEAVREQRGSFERPGQNSPFRDRPAEESLRLLRRMRAGEFLDGACVLRARIDMAHANVLMRDPLLYRIRHARHHRTGERWCIYPMYDYAHPLEDAFEGVTHSICTLEFENNRELYDWVLDNLGPWDPRPRQYEFARLALGYTVLSKRKLLRLVNERLVSGWDDPRMPTLAGLRRRGVTPEALLDFAELIGVAKNNSAVDIGKLEFAIRSDLERRAPRAMAVLDPLRVVIENWPEDRVEELEIPWWPGETHRTGEAAPLRGPLGGETHRTGEAALLRGPLGGDAERGGSRPVPFGRELFVERGDFTLDPPSGWKRLAPGREVRLAGAHVVRCGEVVRDASGKVLELRCSYDPSSGAGDGADRRRCGTIHWVHASRSLPVEVRLYDRLFSVEQPDAEGDLLSGLNPDSLVLAAGARVEPALGRAAPGSRYQFLRQGYFFVDPVDARPGAPVFNRTIALKDTWGTRAAARSERPQRKVAPSPPGPRDGSTGGELGPSPRRKGRAEFRAELRATTPALVGRFARYQAALGLSEGDADLLTGDPAIADYFDAAVEAHRVALPDTRPQAAARSVARWLLNELLGLAKEVRLDRLLLSGAAFGRLVSLVDSGRATPAAGKTILASLVERGGEPEARLKELGLAKVVDREAIEAAIAQVLQAQRLEVERYRLGEKKLFGVLLGAVMRQTQGTSDAAVVRELLQQRLG